MLTHFLKDSSRKSIVAGFFIVFLIIAQQFIGLSGQTQLGRVINNSLHTPWFLVLTLLLWQLINVRIWKWSLFPKFNLIQSIIICSILSLGLAIGTEVLQTFSRRDASWSDVLRDMLGAGAAISLIVIHHYKSRSKYLQVGFFSFIFIALIYIASLSIIEVGAYYYGREDRLPKLVDFSDKTSLINIDQKRRFAILDDFQLWPEPVQNVGKLTLHPRAEWPGLSLLEVYPDWSRYQWLVIEVYLEGETSIPFMVRAETSISTGIENTFETEINSGVNKLKVAIDSFVPGFNNGTIEINNLHVFSSRESRGRVLNFIDIRLE